MIKFVVRFSRGTESNKDNRDKKEKGLSPGAKKQKVGLEGFSSRFSCTLGERKRRGTQLGFGARKLQIRTSLPTTSPPPFPTHSFSPSFFPETNPQFFSCEIKIELQPLFLQLSLSFESAMRILPSVDLEKGKRTKPGGPVFRSTYSKLCPAGTPFLFFPKVSFKFCFCFLTLDSKRLQQPWIFFSSGV